MNKKVNKNLIKKYIIWFVVSVILIIIAIYTDSKFFATFGGVLFGSCFIDFISTLFGGYFYD